MAAPKSNAQFRNLPEAACPPMRLLMIAILAIGAGAATNRYLYATANQNYVGRIEVDSMTIRAPVDGILQNWEVTEGQVVDPQALLCNIGGQNLNRQLQIQQQDVERLCARLATLKAEVDVKLNEHLSTVESDIYQAELQSADLLQKKYYFELERMAWRDQRESYEQNKSSKTSKNQSVDELDDKLINCMLKEESALNSIEAAEAQLEICSTRLEKLQKQKEEMRERVQLAVGLSEIELQYEQSKAELENLELQLSLQKVRAASVGTIANIRRRPGEYVKAGEVLAELFLLDEAYAVADVPTSHSHNFQVEMPVRCRFPNGETRTGVVTHMAISASKDDEFQSQNGPAIPMRIEQTGALWPKIPIGGQITVIR